MKILTINPGSTSTKIGVFNDNELEFEVVLRHTAEELAPFQKVADQYDFRKKTISDALAEHNCPIASLDAVVGRGGLVKPIKGGTYEVNEALLSDLKAGVQGEHASNLGGIIAHEIAAQAGGPAYIVDPVVVDEMEEVARIAGHPAFARRSVFHALNQKAIAKKYAKECGVPYEKLNLIVVHMGGGITVGAHRQGRVIDVNNGLDGEGPFSPERSGTLPVTDLVKMCYSGKYSEKEMKAMIKPEGGLVAYFGTTDVKELTERAHTDEKVRLVLDAMTYQVAKDIGAMAAVLGGKVDAVLLTGGLCYSQEIVATIRDRVSFISDVKAYPGEDELKALCEGALRVLNGEEQAEVYK